MNRVLLIIGLVLVTFIGYRYISYKNRTNTKISQFENTFIKNFERRQKDMCGKTLSGNTVSDFYVSSGFSPFLTGFLKYDYVSLKMLEKVIIYGCRYIELEVFDKEKKNNTDPVIGVSNEDGSLIESQNYIECVDVFNLISRICFSERNLDNFNEPFFIYLNIKTKNKYTINRLYDIITSSLNHRLLDNSFNYQQKNIAQTKMCELTEKIVLFSSSGYRETNLERIINMSTDSIYFRRIKYENLPHNINPSENSDIPSVSLVTKQIRFTENIIYILNDTDLLKLGATPGMVLKISGSENEQNNSKGNVFTIKQITKNTIILKEHIFKDENSRNQIALKFFEEEYKLKNLYKQNKSSITVVYPGNDFFNFNYDPDRAWELGCQFVCMNFQKIDYNLKKKYMKKFRNFSFVLKPTNLRYIPRQPKQDGIGMVNKFIETGTGETIDNVYNNFYEISLVPSKYYHSEGCCINKTKSKSITCSKYSLQESRCSGIDICEYTTDKSKCEADNINIVVSGKTLSISPEQNSNNSVFHIVKGLNKKYGTISIKHNDHFLVSSDSCCYLSLKTGSTSSLNFKENASFTPVKPLCNDNRFISFMQTKENKKYYIKYRKEFNYDERLYKTMSQKHTFITEITSDDGKIGVYSVNSSKGYLSLGDIFVKGEHSKKIETINTMLLKGSVKPPIDFELRWKSSNIHIWKPVSPDGYVTLGVCVTMDDKKPSLSKYCCVPVEQTREIKLDNDMFWSNKGSDLANKLSIWQTPTKSYFITNLDYTKPSEFASPVYDFEFDSKDLLDKLYMGKVNSNETENACFKMNNLDPELPDKPNKFTFDTYKQKNNNKLTIYTDYKKKCLGLEDSYWTDIYKGSVLSKPYNIKAVDCRSDSYFGTNFVTHQDGTVRIKDNSMYCFENKDQKLVLNNCSSKDSQKFRYDNTNSRMYSLLDNMCITHVKQPAEEGSVFSFTETNLKDKNQDILIHKDIIKKCIQKQDIVFVLQKIKRAEDMYFSNQKNNTIFFNVFNETIDRKNFHVYIKAQVIDMDRQKYKLKLYSRNNKIIYVPKNNKYIIPSFIPSPEEVNTGSEVLVSNGGLNGVSEESSTRWKGNIVGKSGNKYIVYFSINSIEADMNRDAKGRPRKNEKKEIDIQDIILHKPSISCEL